MVHYPWEYHTIVATFYTMSSTTRFLIISLILAFGNGQQTYDTPPSNNCDLSSVFGCSGAASSFQAFIDDLFGALIAGTYTSTLEQWHDDPNTQDLLTRFTPEGVVGGTFQNGFAEVAPVLEQFAAFDFQSIAWQIQNFHVYSRTVVALQGLLTLEFVTAVALGPGIPAGTSGTTQLVVQDTGTLKWRRSGYSFSREWRLESTVAFDSIVFDL